MKRRIPVLSQAEQRDALQQRLREFVEGDYQLVSDGCRQLVAYAAQPDPLLPRV